MVNQREQIVSPQAQGNVSAKAQTCRCCGQPLPDLEPLILFGRTFKIKPTVCARCGEDSQKPAEPTRWERICPDEYQRTDANRLDTSLGAGATIRPGSDPRSPGNMALGDSSLPVQPERESREPCGCFCAVC